MPWGGLLNPGFPNHQMSKQSQERYHDYLQTDYWKQVQFKVKERAEFRCQTCNSQLDLVAHHRTYEHRGHELDHLGDLVCLCKRCHAAIHSLIGQDGRQQQPSQVVHQVVVERVTISKKQRRRLREAELQRLIRQGEEEHSSAPEVPMETGTTKPILLKKPKVIPHTEEDIERDMPPGDGPTITLTKELVDRLRTSGTFCNAALAPIGLIKSDIMAAGWPGRLVGRVVSRGAYRAALAGRYYYGARMPVSHDELPVDFQWLSSCRTA